MSVFKSYEEMTPDQQVAYELGRRTALDEALADRESAHETVRKVARRNEELVEALEEILRLALWYADVHAGPELEVHHALKVEVLDIAQRALTESRPKETKT